MHNMVCLYPCLCDIDWSDSGCARPTSGHVLICLSSLLSFYSSCLRLSSSPLCHTHISLFIVPGPLSAPGQAFLWARSRAGRQGADPECLSVSAGVRACVVQECQGANYCETLPMSCTDRNDAFVFMVYPEIVKVMDVALSSFLLSVLMFILKT